MSTYRLTFLFLLSALTFGCFSDSSPPPAAPLPTTIKLTLTTSGTLPAGSALAGIGFTLTLPDGVTAPQDSTGEVDSSRMIKASGLTASSGLVATSIKLDGRPARISLAVASKQKGGFGIGETLQLSLNLTQGGAFTRGDFTLSDFTAADVNEKAVSGLLLTITEVKTE